MFNFSTLLNEELYLSGHFILFLSDLLILLWILNLILLWNEMDALPHGAVFFSYFMVHFLILWFIFLYGYWMCSPFLILHFLMLLTTWGFLVFPSRVKWLMGTVCPSLPNHFYLGPFNIFWVSETLFFFIFNFIKK